MEKNKLKAVIFDLDGVITDSAEYHFMAWKMLADKLEIPFDKEFNENLKGVSRMDSLNLILKRGKVNFSEQEKERLADEKNDLYKELIKQITPNDMLGGIKSFLEELKENCIKTAIASVSKNAFFIIDRLQAGEYFDYIVDAQIIARTKPYPDVFLNAAQALNTPVENCVGIEDAKAGITAIKAANMRAVGVGTKEQMSQADLILQNTSEITLKTILSAFLMEV